MGKPYSLPNEETVKIKRTENEPPSHYFNELVHRDGTRL